MKKTLIFILTLALLLTALPSGTFAATVSAPSITTYNVDNGVRITISSRTNSADIYYTLDGTTPSASHGERYTGQFVLDEAGKYNIKAIAIKGSDKSSTATKTVNILDCGYDKDTSPDEMIRISFFEGKYQVEFLNFDGYTVYYTTGLSTRPTPGVSKKITDGVLYIDKPTVINLLICKSGHAPVFKQVKATQPAWDSKGSVENVVPEIQIDYGGKNVIMTTLTEGADIYYRMSEVRFNDDVTKSDTKYTGRIAIDRPGTYYIRAFAAMDGLFDSDQTAVFTVSVEKCPEPKVRVVPNSKNSNRVDVTASVDDDSEIYYTADGSTPNQNSARYTGTRTFAGNYDLKFVAMKRGSVSSDVVVESVKTGGQPINVSAKTANNGAKTVTLSPINENAQIYYKITDQIADPYDPSNNPYMPEADVDELYTDPIEFNDTGDYYIWAREYSDGVYGPLYSASVRVTIVGLDIRLGTLPGGIKTATVTTPEKRNVYCVFSQTETPFDEVYAPENLYTYPLTIPRSGYVTAVEVDSDGSITDQARVWAEVVNGPLTPEEVGGISFSSATYDDYTEVTLGCADDKADIFYVLDNKEDNVATPANQRYTEPLELKMGGWLHVTAARPGYTSKSATYRIFASGRKTAAPVVDAKYNSSRNLYMLTFTSSTPNAKFYYTIDGSVPKAGVNEAAGATAAANEGVTLKVIAVADGYDPSDVVSQVLSETDPDQCDSIIPEMGDILGGKEISLTTLTDGADIYYTLNGSDPNADSLLYDYEKGITVTAEGTTEIKAVAAKNGWLDSDVLKIDVELERLKAPSVQMGQLGGGRALVRMSVQSGASAYYTTDGSVPTPGAAGTTQCSGDFYINESCTITAVAAAPGYVNSPLYQNRFAVDDNMVATPLSDDLTATPVMGGKKLEIKSATEDAYIFYSLKSGELKDITPDTLYTEPVFLNKAQNTITVVAKKSGMKDSSKVRFSFPLPKSPMPKASIEANSAVSSGDEVVLTVENPDGDENSYTIFYTTDGSAPTVDSAKYTGPIEITGDTRIRAAAAAEGVVMSDILELWYTVDNGEAPALTVDADGLEKESNYISGSVTVNIANIDVAGKKVIAAVYCGEKLLQAVSAVPDENTDSVELGDFDVLIEDETDSGIVVKAFVTEANSLAPLCKSSIVVK